MKKQKKGKKNIIYITTIIGIILIIGIMIYQYINQEKITYDFITIKYSGNQQTKNPQQSLLKSVGIDQNYLIVNNYEYYEQCQKAFNQSGYDFMDQYSIDSKYFLDHDLIILDNYLPKVDGYIPNILELKKQRHTLNINLEVNYNDIYGESNLGAITYVEVKKNSIQTINFKINYNKTEVKLESDEKPILYIYPKEEQEISIKFEKENLLKTTYPKYNSIWKIKAYPDGTLYDEKGNSYYALYWEEKSIAQVDFKTGFYVTKDNAITFLENTLTKIGLNNRERNEMIMYWLKILENNEKSLVYFELTEERNQNSPLQIEPKPDSILRIAMHVKKISKKQIIKPQILTPFERKGFTIVEWGGVNHTS